MISKVNIAIMASGRGSNAKAIIDFANKDEALFHVKLIISNKKDAGVHNHAKSAGIKSQTINKDDLYDNRSVLELLRDQEIDMIVLAGFLWLIPGYLVEAFPKRIINIHPALLPKYGGKGMYGNHIHRAVKRNKEPASGITIHFVNEVYDEGAIIFQTQCQIAPANTPEEIAKRVLTLEHDFYPRIINGVSSRIG